MGEKRKEIITVLQVRTVRVRAWTDQQPTSLQRLDALFDSLVLGPHDAVKRNEIANWIQRSIIPGTCKGGPFPV